MWVVLVLGDGGELARAWGCWLVGGMGTQASLLWGQIRETPTWTGGTGDIQSGKFPFYSEMERKGGGMVEGKERSLARSSRAQHRISN